MTRPRIAIAGFQHETNRFTPFPTVYDDFLSGGAWPGLTRGTDVLTTFADLNIPIGGFIKAGGEWDLVPILWTAAEPAGLVAQSAFDRIAEMITDGLRSAGRLDGVYLDLHGAMVTDEHDDGEGELLRRVRQVVGSDLPVAVSLDLHANVTPDLVALASSLAIYRTYPHVDMAETGARAKALLHAELARGRPFARAFRQLSYLVPLQAQSTVRQPAGRLYGLIETFQSEAVPSVDLALGFPPSDIHDCGASVVAYAETAGAAEAAAQGYLATVEAAETEFHNPLIPAEDAVRSALVSATSGRPVVIADVQDNPGAGATGDTTGLLRALVGLGARRAALGTMWDPDAAAQAHAAGLGAEFEALIGGRYDIGGPAYRATVRVEGLSDGNFLCTGPMYGGTRAHLGPMASLLILDPASEVRLVVSSLRTQNADQAHFRHIGIEPTAQAILAVKSTGHFLADYLPIAAQVIFAEAPGANPCRLDRIAFRHLRPGVRLGPNGPAFKLRPAAKRTADSLG